MNNYQNFIFDLDGTLYHGDASIPNAVIYVNKLTQSGKNVYLLTNNSTLPVKDIFSKMTNMGYEIDIKNIITSSQITHNYAKLNGIKNPYIIGEIGLKENFFFTELESIDAVITGLDRDFNYEKLVNAVELIRSGSRFIATNTDRLLPTANGYNPGAGTIVNAISYATNIEPIIMGKPSRVCLDYLEKNVKINKKNTLFVGDNLLTDIKQADDYGYDSLLVMSGVHNIRDVEKLGIKPKYISESLSEKEIRLYENK